MPPRRRSRADLDPALKQALAPLKSPEAIQRFLDETPYSSDDFYRSPLRVARDRRAHCVDGALFAALALRAIGHPPLIVDMRAVRDDDHVIALYRRRGRIGAVAKSNTVGLRFREAVYRSLRELVMSYFEVYYNTGGEKTLRSYSTPVDLSRFDDLDWPSRDEAVEPIVLRLDSARHHELLSRAMIDGLSPVDDRSYRANLMGVDPAGLYAADKLKL
jgi:hypothetical protein